MTGVLDGIEVLDLSWGIGGPMAAMLLGRPRRASHQDRAAGRRRSRSFSAAAASGKQVWNRGKRSAVLDLDDAGRPRTSLALVRRADVLIESFAPGVTARARHRLRDAAGAQPAAVYCSITGYGDDGRHADRPALRRAGRGAHRPAVGEPRGPGRHARPPRRRPRYPPRPRGARRLLGGGAAGRARCSRASPWPSLATCYLATLAISAALRAREVTGRGQRVETSLLQGVLATHARRLAAGRARRTPRTSRAGSSIRARPRRCSDCADGRWVHHWTPAPELRARRCPRATRSAHRRDEVAARDRRRGSAIASEEMLAPPPLPAAHGRGVRQVPRRRVGRAGGQCRGAAAAHPLPRGSARRPAVPGRRLRHRGDDPGARSDPPGRPRLRAARVPDRSRRPRRRHVGEHTAEVRAEADAAAGDATAATAGARACRSARTGLAARRGPRARPRARGRRARSARRCSPTSAPTSSR